MDPFYQKYLDVDGIPIVASSVVTTKALFRARETMDEMLLLRPDIKTTIGNVGVRVAIMATGSVLSDLPEFSHFTEFAPGLSWDERVRGGGVGPTTAIPVLAIAEENLLCNQNDYFPYEDIFVHEFAHAILNKGIEPQPGGNKFRRQLEALYEDALDNGLWEGTYASENPDEYWAEGVQSWFDLNDVPGPIHNNTNTRAELESYDPGLARLIGEVFGDVVVSSSCHPTIDVNYQFTIRGVIVGPDGQPQSEIAIWAWQEDVLHSGYAITGHDGTFEISVPQGSFSLDVYAEIGKCSFVGWYDGIISITSERHQAFRLIVDESGITGIEIRLPMPPDELPRIAHCANS